MGKDLIALLRITSHYWTPWYCGRGRQAVAGAQSLFRPTILSALQTATAKGRGSDRIKRSLRVTTPNPTKERFEFGMADVALESLEFKNWGHCLGILTEGAALLGTFSVQGMLVFVKLRRQVLFNYR